jgi:CelD/BcsL family acetyltransferase involved in cellulose biosynthesis
MMSYELDPLQDSRWPQFLASHPAASVFHSREWLDALHRTYRYKPVALTLSPPGQPLGNAIVFCAVKSSLTGCRLVSLPFSDHCETLSAGQGETDALLRSVPQWSAGYRCKYVELRPVTPLPDGGDFATGDTFWLHRLELKGTAEELFSQFHKDCVQRRIRHAERQQLEYQEGRSESLLRAFYKLMVMTRRRQHLPPQPLAWFRNLSNCLGDQLKIRIVSVNGQPFASILTVRYKDSMIYKYGCSDPAFNKLGGVALLFWRTVQEATAAGLRVFDMGRSDMDNLGLIQFKDRWGAARSQLVYRRYSKTGPTQASLLGWKLELAKQLFERMPDSLLIASGRVLYRHIG